MSKFLKFKQALNTHEAITYLSLVSSEKVTKDTITSLIDENYLHPVLGYGELILGFTKPAFMDLQSGLEVSPSVCSYIGTPKNHAFRVAEIVMPYAESTKNEHIFFARPAIDNETGEIKYLNKYSIENLQSLDPVNLEDMSFPFEQILDLQAQLDSKEPPSPIKKFDKKLIEIDRNSKNQIHHVTEIIGFNKPFREKKNETLKANLIKSDSEEAPSYRLAISALLSLLSEPKRSALNQAGVISEILERHPGVRGLGKRSLETIFSAANKSSKTLG